MSDVGLDRRLLAAPPARFAQSRDAFVKDLAVPDGPLHAALADLQQDVAQQAREGDAGVEDGGEHSAPFRRRRPSLAQRRTHILRLGFLEIEPLGIGDHVRESLVGAVALAPTVFQQIVEADLAAPTRSVEGDLAGFE
jgi:hypothetical protein